MAAALQALERVPVFNNAFVCSWNLDGKSNLFNYNTGGFKKPYH
jgi:hypothetical protein